MGASNRRRRMVLSASLALLQAVGGVSVSVASASAARSIRGRVVSGVDRSPEVGSVVFLVTVNPRGETVERRRSVTGRAGRFSFRGVRIRTTRSYFLTVRYQGGLFGKQWLSGEGQKSTTITVWPTTRDQSAIAISNDALYGEVNGDELRVVESVTIANRGTRAYIGGAPAASGAPASFVFALPPSASAIQLIESDLSRFAPGGVGLEAISAIPPGETRTRLAYRVTRVDASFDLSRVALYPVEEMTINSPRSLEVSSARFENRGEVMVGELRLRKWSAQGFVPADQIRAVLAKPANTSVTAPALVTTVLVLILVAAVVVPAFRHGKASRMRAPREKPSSHELMERIARLDLGYERGEISSRRWARHRHRLKQELLELIDT